MFDKITEISLLYDFYGQLLTPRQNEAMRLYHEENYSLSEIADEFEISRQAVHDALKAAEKSLTEYEEKLGLMKKFENSRNAAAEIEQEIDRIKDEYGDDKMLSARLDKIKGIIEKADF